jgi:hypothetical protein
MEAVVSDHQSADVCGNHDDAEYDQFLVRMGARFAALTEAGNAPLFTTNADGLWDAYLGAFSDPAERQYHNCHACRDFIGRFGGLVTIGEDGRTNPAMWDESLAPEQCKASVAAMARIVRKANVTGVWYCKDAAWGKPVTGIWRHLSVTPPTNMVFRELAQTAGQAMAEKREDHKNVMGALSEFDEKTVDQALQLLKSDALYRGEHVLGQAEWLHALYIARKDHRGVWSNLVWRAIALAPAGFCHPRASMIGTLLDDIRGGMDFGEVSRRFREKMHPLQYQRPQAAPSRATIEQAEKLVEQMGIVRSLLRRFARLDEIEAIWKPSPIAGTPKDAGVFSRLKARGEIDRPNLIAPPKTMTWEKFRADVLPTAERIEIHAPYRGAYSALLTAVDHDAPPILQWDTPDRRNPFSWYFWMHGSTAEQFGLAAGQFHTVTAIAFQPSMWHGGFEHQGKGVMFVISGARDSRNCGSALFPEILKSELHGVRSVIEAHSQSTQLDGAEDASAAGLMMRANNLTWDVLLKVHASGYTNQYKLDRWE